MHAHRVKIFDRTNNDDVVREVAHDLELEFLPAENGFLDECFVDGREIEAAGENFHEFFAVVGDAAAAAAEREGWANDDRKTDFAGKFEAVFEIVDQRRFG